MSIDKDGKISFFSLMTSGANSIYCNYKDILMPLNVGTNSEGGYTTQILVKEPQNEWYDIEFKKGYIQSLVTINNNIYGDYIILGKNRTSGICVFDKTKKSLVNQKEFDHRCFFNTPISVYDNKLVLFGYDNHSGALDRRGRLEAYNPNNLKKEKTIIFNDEFTPRYSVVYKEMLLIVGDNDRIKFFNKNFDLINEYSLSDKALSNEYLNKDALIGQIETKDDKLYVLYRFNFCRENKKMPLALHIYNINSGNLLQKINLNFPPNSEWYCEYATFSIIE